ncbi:MAG: hypothetical protein Q9180_008162, partial [Flavoplaca navasiana]
DYALSNATQLYSQKRDTMDDPLWGLRALEDSGAGDQEDDAPQTPNNVAKSENHVDDAPQTTNDAAEAGNHVDDALQTPNDVPESRIRAGMYPETPSPFSPQVKYQYESPGRQKTIESMYYALRGPMRPPVQLWAFPPVLSIADRAFLKPLMDYQRDLHGNASQSLVDLDRQFLILNTVIDIAEDQCNSRLACIIIRIVFSGDVGTSMAENALIDAIAIANEKIDHQLSHISQSKRLHSEAERIGRELNATATKEHTSPTVSSLMQLVGLIKWTRKQFYDSAQKEWNRHHKYLSEIHEAQAGSNQMGQSLAQSREATQRIRRQLRRLNDRTQYVPEGEFTQVEDWFWEYVVWRFAEDGKLYTQSHRDALLRDLEQWCSQCSGAST